MGTFPSTPRGRAALTILAMSLALGAPAAAPLRHAHSMGPVAAAADIHAGHVMSDAAMQRFVADFYATHPVRRGSASATAVVADTFTASGFQFDTDHNTATVVDTAHITTGQSVLWQEVSGFHTVTSGTGSSDPNVGLLFDVPLDPSATSFTFTFNAAGTYPFFCRNHELSNMRGVVVVGPPAGVTPPPAASAVLGFSAEPWPNPTRAGVAFRFALSEAGQARLEVMDVDGRRVAVPLDTWLPAGDHGGVWDGLMADGHPAPAGMYYLRLQVPGYEGSRRVAVTR